MHYFNIFLCRKLRSNIQIFRSYLTLILNKVRADGLSLIMNNVLENGYAKIFIGDSKEGWVSALMAYFDLLTKPEYDFVHTIKISYKALYRQYLPTVLDYVAFLTKQEPYI